MRKTTAILVPLLLLLVGGYFLFFYHDGEAPAAEPKNYISNQGPVFGTFYHVRYAQPEGKDLQQDIIAALQRVDQSLSMFNPHSRLAAFNDNRTDSVDADFVNIYRCASQVWQVSGHAFDITVAPLVDLWGFGRTERGEVTDEDVRQLLPAIGMDKLSLDGMRLIKSNPSTRIDCSAIAKGYATDAVADVLTDNGCTDFIVEIGGEIVARGVNEKGEPWHVGINTPDDDPENTSTDIQRIVMLSGKALATSGNYRRYYEVDGRRVSHTIDPRTGYPAQSDILSATVIAPTCMQADAYATAFMVVGTEKALQICDSDTTLECLLITHNADKDRYEIVTSKNFEK